jgi:QWRF family
MDMTETIVPRRKSVECGRVGGGMGSVMGLFARRKKVDPAEEEMVHQLRIILAQLVQWRFVNARAGPAMERRRFVSEVGWMNLLKLAFVLDFFFYLHI